MNLYYIAQLLLQWTMNVSSFIKAVSTLPFTIYSIVLE